ncbi:MAG: FHA domain-containing protein [Bacteroidales bacterium]|nr:FHA domain-containing protein [Clostridium sp.]MCM1203429.1 FHA domain-containing protein [Bacteroidales bacterium]
MKKISFRIRNFDKEQFLTFNIDNDADLDEELLDFIEDEEPKGIVPVIFEENDEFDTFSYNVTDKIHLCELSNQEINAEMVLKVLRGLILSLIDMSEYRIPLSYLVLNRNYIYVDSEYQIEFICIPLEDMQEETDINSFLRNFLASLRYEPSGNDNYVARLFTYINNYAVFNLRNMLTLVEELMEELDIEIPENSSGEIYAEYEEVLDVAEKAESEEEVPDSFGGTAGFEEEGLAGKPEAEEETIPVEEAELEEEAAPIEEAEIEEETVPAEEAELEEEAVPIEEAELEEEAVPAEEAEAEEETVPAEEAEAEEEIVPVEETELEEEIVPAEEAEAEEEAVPAEEAELEEETVPAEEAEPKDAALAEEADSDEAEILTEEPDTSQEIVNKLKEKLARNKKSQELDEEPGGTEESDGEKKGLKKPAFKTKDTSITGVVIPDELDEFLAEKEMEEEMAHHEESSLKIKKNIKVNRASIVKNTQEELKAAAEVESEAEAEKTGGDGDEEDGAAANQAAKGAAVPKVNPYLIRVNTKERVMITKQNFKIGKASMGVDYTVKGNGAVSRVHAIITNKDGAYFIKDNKSTNHTYVNGKNIEDGENEELVNDSKIVLGDEEFIFKL